MPKSPGNGTANDGLLDRGTKISQLEELARQSRFRSPMPAAVFLALVFSPTGRRSYPTVRARERGPGKDGELGYWELRAMALEWDDMGLTTPMEFVEAVACEAIGHPKSAAVASLMLEARPQCNPEVGYS